MGIYLDATLLCDIFCCFFFFFSSRRRHTRLQGDWSSDVCSSDLTTRPYAVAADGRVVLIDPVPLDPAQLGRLGAVEAIVLGTPSHQRAAWSLRREIGRASCRERV